MGHGRPDYQYVGRTVSPTGRHNQNCRRWWPAPRRHNQNCRPRGPGTTVLVVTRHHERHHERGGATPAYSPSDRPMISFWISVVPP